MVSPRYITTAQVRTITGITSTLVSDSDMDDIIGDVEFQIERFMNTTYTPKKEIDVQDGQGKHVIYVNHTPLLAVRSITDDDTSIDITTVNFSNGGRIRFSPGGATSTTSFKRKENKTVIEYVYGAVEFPESGGTETLMNDSAGTSVGTTVSITVDSITGFTDLDWCAIYGTDGFRETFQISGAPSGTTIVADQLLYTHSDNSFIRLLAIPTLVERLMKVSSGIAAVANVVGSSFDDITGYDMGDFRVQKGEPYTQWRETALQLINERDRIMERLQPASFSMVI